MNNAVNTIDSFVEGSGGGNVLDDSEGEATVAILQMLRLRLTDLVGSGCAVNGAMDFVAPLQEAV